MKNIIKRLFIEHSALQGYVAHLGHGIANVFLAVYVHWTIALLFGFGFIIFELNQEWHLRDQAHQDIAGWLLGIVLGSIVYIIFF